MKAVPRKCDVDGSDAASSASTSPDIFLFTPSLSKNDFNGLKLQPSSLARTMGLSWVSMLQGDAPTVGNLSVSSGLKSDSIPVVMAIPDCVSSTISNGSAIPAVESNGGCSTLSAGCKSPSHVCFVGLYPNPTIVNDDSRPTVSCPQPARRIAKITKVDVEPEIKYWEFSVVCYVTSANPLLM